jgi:hypothetical protein
MSYITHNGAASPIAPIAKIVSAAPSPDDDLQFAAIIDQADIVASIARSIAEAAFGGDTTWLRLYRSEFRHHAIGLMGFIREVAPIEGGRA